MNYIEDIINPESPRVHAKEQVLLYAPLASSDVKGVASFYKEHFVVTDGMVRIKPSYLDTLLSNKVSTMLKSLNLKYVRGQSGMELQLLQGDTLISKVALQ